jgi:hypothetical protein
MGNAKEKKQEKGKEKLVSWYPFSFLVQFIHTHVSWDLAFAV